MNRVQLVEMLQLQDHMNSTVNPTWLTAGYAWHRAIMVESVEALEHYGWKWWKKQEPDVPQIRLELVDIWHFILSLSLDRNAGEHALTVEMLMKFMTELEEDPDKYGEVSTLGVHELFDLMAGTAGVSQMFNGGAFMQLMKRFDMGWDTLYQMYIAKNVLNMFRQANGYKEGTYVKVWDGLEDNVILMSIINDHPTASADELQRLLQERYDVVV